MSLSAVAAQMSLSAVAAQMRMSAVAARLGSGRLAMVAEMLTHDNALCHLAFLVCGQLASDSEGAIVNRLEAAGRRRTHIGLFQEKQAWIGVLPRHPGNMMHPWSGPPVYNRPVCVDAEGMRETGAALGLGLTRETIDKAMRDGMVAPMPRCPSPTPVTGYHRMAWASRDELGACIRECAPACVQLRDLWVHAVLFQLPPHMQVGGPVRVAAGASGGGGAGGIPVDLIRVIADYVVFVPPPPLPPIHPVGGASPPTTAEDAEPTGGPVSIWQLLPDYFRRAPDPHSLAALPGPRSDP